jgi:hypothetical protein
MEDKNVEEGVKQQNRLGLDRTGVEQYRLTAFVIEAVAVQCWLNHDEGVADILVVQDVTVEGGLIGRVVEDLQEL